MLKNIAFILFWLVIIKKVIIFKFTPKKSCEIYDKVLAHRGFHMLYPENTLEAYKAAIDSNFGIELDIRYLKKDGNIICFHDRYTNRLLRIPGKISTMFRLDELKRFSVQGSNCKIPSFEEALDIINGQCLLLVEVKGAINKDYFSKLNQTLDSYMHIDTVYFHTKNLKTYKKLKRLYGDKVFYILNPLRKRFNFIKGTDYKLYKSKYKTLLQEIDIEIPSPEDIGQVITQAVQNLENKKEILASIGGVLNDYETRIDSKHWANNSLWLHRGIISNKYLEHSRESFEACIEFARENEIYVTVEFDVMYYKGEVRCYHNDRIPSILGQEKSCAEKLKLENSLRLSEILEIFAGNEEYINLAIDIKDYHIANRILPQLIINDLENSNFRGNFILMSYNPFVLNYFKKVRKDYLRAQIGHSLSGLRRVPFFRFPWILNGALGILFDIGHADATVFDNSEWIFWMIAYHRNIKGKPVFIYAPKNYMEIEGFVGKESISNFIIENAENKESWPIEYIERFKRAM